MQPEPRDKAFTYRMPESRHTKLKVLAANTGADMQDIIDSALDAYFGELKKDPPKPKRIREAHSALDALLEAPEQPPLSLIRRIVLDSLDTTVQILEKK